MIKRHHRAYPAQCQVEPTILFLFGDNMLHRGYAGQACIRDEPNSLGIPTKWNPSMAETAFFGDEGWPDKTVSALKISLAIRRAFLLAEAHAATGWAVSIPADGLGTGLAQLPTRAPAIHAYIESCIRDLEGRYR